MAFLNIGSFGTVPVAFDSATKTIERIGFQGRAYAGSYRESVKIEKRQWHCRTDWLLDASAASLEAVVANGAQVSCSGDFLAATVTCIVTVGTITYLNSGTTDGKGFMRALDLTLIEV